MDKNKVIESVYYEEVDMLLEFISKGGNFNFSINDVTPLYIACQEGNFEIAKLLIENNADINFCCDDKTSPLYGASMNGHIGIVKLLLEKGADPNLSRYDRKTPLFVASSQEENIEVIELLIQYGANVNSCDDELNTPLYIAVQEEIYENVESLLKNNANVNHHGIYGITPLIKAIHKYNDEIVELLLNHGANLNARYGETTSAFEVVKNNVHIPNKLKTIVMSKKDENWLNDNDYVKSQKYLIDQIMFAIKLFYYRQLTLEDCFEFNLFYAKDIKLDPVNFSKLESFTTNYQSNYNEDEINFYIEKICVPLKRAQLFNAAHKVYKSVLAYYGISTNLLKSWGKLLACAGQIQMAKKMFQLGKTNDLQFGNDYLSQCGYHLKQLEDSIKNDNLVEYISALMGDKNFVFNKVDVE